MPTTRPSRPITRRFPSTTISQLVEPDSKPYRVSTTPIMPAWLKAKAPTRTKEIVLVA